jgi:serine protease AprX
VIIMARYRVFCPQSEVENLPVTVTVEESYPAFSIVTADAQTLEEVKKHYPVEDLPAPKAPPQMPAVMGLAARAAQPRTRGPYTLAVRFRAPVRPSWLKEIAAIGCESRGAIGRSTLVVSCPNKTSLEKLHKLSSVVRVSTYVPKIQISPETFADLGVQVDDAAIAAAARRLAGAGPRRSRKQPLPGILTADFFTTDDRDRAKRNLRRQGIRALVEAGDSGLIIDVTETAEAAEAVQRIAVLAGLRSLAQKHVKKLFNDVAREVIGSGVIDANPNSLGLSGEGEIVAVADTGLDTGDATTLHADFQGRVRDIQSFAIGPSLSPLLKNPGGDDGAADLYSGHGTHVCGSVLGNGARAQALGLDPIQGTAPEAELVFQAIEQATDWNLKGVLYWMFQVGQKPPPSGLFGIPEDLHDLFLPAYEQGARIHSNSWGGGEPGAYDEQCLALDRFVWEHPDFLVVVAAGNDGTDTNPTGDGIDPMTVSSPGTAKNCLTVGASENNRPEQFSSETYGAWWPSDFPADPFHSDPMVDSPGDVVAFSSRGPCVSGRRKPDLIAPGTFVLSTRSSQIATNNFAWRAFPPAKQDYMYMGGTSMATPLVAGCAAVVRQYLRQSRNIDTPSAALLKAALIHSAAYLSYRFASPGSSAWADDEQGWGLVDLQRALNPQPPTNVLFFDETAGLQTGEMRELAIEISDGSVPLRLTLVYNDFPGEDLVNNLNLIVHDPNGRFFVGNDFSGSGAPDSGNNVEGIVIANPTTGNWSIRVVASDIPEGPQLVALVVSGGGARSI